jgi:hypothetical protein
MNYKIVVFDRTSEEATTEISTMQMPGVECLADLHGRGLDFKVYVLQIA